MYSGEACRTPVAARGEARVLRGVVVAILRLAGEALALAADDALDEPLGRHQRHVLGRRPSLEQRWAGAVRHHHVIPAGGKELWETVGGERSARGEARSIF